MVMATAGSDVVGIDWHVDLDEGRRRVGDKAVQGNLDPARCLAGEELAIEATREVLALAGTDAGYIFNLGHGVLPATNPDVLTAVVKAVEDARPVRFVQVGTAGGEENIELSGSALRSSAIVLMGSGLKSVRMSVLLESIASVFAAAGPARLKIATRAVPLSEVESVWQNAAGNPRVVFTIG